MSDAKQCDRCGELYVLDISDEKDNVAGLCLMDKYGRETKSFDLCQKCRDELMNWPNIYKREQLEKERETIRFMASRIQMATNAIKMTGKERSDEFGEKM